jgi:hypothetical protein
MIDYSEIQRHAEHIASAAPRLTAEQTAQLASLLRHVPMGAAA